MWLTLVLVCNEYFFAIQQIFCKRYKRLFISILVAATLKRGRVEVKQSPIIEYQKTDNFASLVTTAYISE